MPLTLKNCSVTTNSIRIQFSHPVTKASAEEAENYQVFGSGIATPIQPSKVALDPSAPTVTLSFSHGTFQSGDSVTVTVSDVDPQDPQQSGFEGGAADITGRVRDRSRTGKIVKDVEDAIAYPILTEEVGYPPSPLAGAQAVPGATGGVALGLVAAKAVTDVLGWK